MTKITLTSLADLQRFVDEYQPSVEVVARIVEHKIKVWPDVNAYASSADLMDSVQKHLEKYRGKELPLFLPLFDKKISRINNRVIQKG